MISIKVNATKPYEVIIGSGVISELGTVIKRTCPKAEKVLFVSDSNVAPLHLGEVIAILREGYGELETEEYIFEAGEQNKNLSTIDNIFDKLASFGMTRTDVIVSLGGGVTTDMAGFAAATYMRGIPVIHLPTSLLAQVDASVGGKTGVDHRSGKNIIGAFYQPQAVIIDVDFVKTLPSKVFTEGMAEVIKYAFIMDKPLYELLNKTDRAELQGDSKLLIEVIGKCAEDKVTVINEDEFDNGRRQLLNFGHTMGHIIERDSNFTVTHGDAVSIGMGIIAKASCEQGLCSKETCEALINLLIKYGLPIDFKFNAAHLARSAMHDKKARGSMVSVIVLKDIGEAVINKMSSNEIYEFIRDVLQA